LLDKNRALFQYGYYKSIAQKKRRGMEGFELHIFQTMVSPWFKNVIVPVVTLFLTVFFKTISKTAVSIERNDFFVCFDLCASAIFVFVIGMIDLANQIVNPPNAKISELIQSQVLAKEFDPSKLATLQNALTSQSQIILTKFGLSSMVLVMMLLLTVVISVMTRCLGWDVNGVAKWGWGIILPNTLGLGLLIVAAIWIKV
jgi:ABC-type transport system involved in multi-copper enzyme maturation permease subunit